MSKHIHFILGASLGTGIQPTAVAVLEQEVWKNERWQPETVALRLLPGGLEASSCFPGNHHRLLPDFGL